MKECQQNCGAIFHACKEEDHLYLCINSLKTCPYYLEGCTKQISKKQVFSHFQSHQRSTMLSCRQKCGATFSANYEKDHLVMCPNSVMFCAYFSSGCTKPIKRKDLLQHLECHQNGTTFECRQKCGTILDALTEGDHLRLCPNSKLFCQYSEICRFPVSYAIGCNKWKDEWSDLNGSLQTYLKHMIEAHQGIKAYINKYIYIDRKKYVSLHITVTYFFESSEDRTRPISTNADKRTETQTNWNDNRAQNTTNTCK